VIVLDASVVVELLTNGPHADRLRNVLDSYTESILVPQLLDVEVISAFRNLAAARRIDTFRANQILADLELLPAERYAHTPLLRRVWELRHNFTAYDAVYIALAEATGAILYTMDEKLVKGHRAQVLLFDRPDRRN
jgi:predicted nucleic acid-binding protein